MGLLLVNDWRKSKQTKGLNASVPSLRITPAASLQREQAPLHPIIDMQKGKTLAWAIEMMCHDHEQTHQALTKNFSEVVAVSAEHNRIAKKAFATFNPSRIADASRINQLYRKAGHNLKVIESRY